MKRGNKIKSTVYDLDTFGILLRVFLTKLDLLNCVKTHYLKDLLFLFVVSLFHLDL